MSAMTSWTLSIWTDAAQLAASVNPRAVPPEAAGVSPPAWFASLRDAGAAGDAACFIAHAMPRYECVMWALRSLIEIRAVDRADPHVVAALRWIDNPSDSLRRAAGELANGIDDDTPGALLCQAIFLAGGSLSGEDLPPVQPPPDVCAKLAVAALLTGIEKTDDPDASLAASLALGEAIIAGA